MRFQTSCVHVVTCALFAMFSAPLAADTLFLEDFQTFIDPGTGEPVLRCNGGGGAGTYPFPDGWLLRNVDNRTPDAQVAYVNAAWEVREDFNSGDSTACVAFSTSWYVPAGVANDWMWTPLIGPLPAGTTRLSWRASIYDPSFPDGYEVRVMTSGLGPPTGGTGVIGNQVTSSTVVFSIAAEQQSWITRSVDLSAYAGQSVWIGFRNNSNDKFLLVIDDILVETVVEFDPRLVSLDAPPTQGYAKLPAPLALGFDLEAQVGNTGTETLTGVVVDADVLVDGLLVEALSSAPVASLGSGTTQAITVGSSVHSQLGAWSVDAMVTATEGDQVVANSALSLPLSVVTADELTRAEGPATGTLGVGSGTGEIGMDVELPIAVKLHATRVMIENVDAQPAPDGDGIGDFNGYSLEARVRGWNAGADEPGELVEISTTAVPADAAIGPLLLEFDFDGLVLPPGRYLMAIAEPGAPEPGTLTVQTMLERYTPGTGWVIWPASPLGGWGNLEEFGVEFERALAITAVLGLPLSAPVAADDAFTVPQFGTFTGDVSLDDQPSDDGGNAWTVATEPDSGLLVMQPSGAFDYTPAAESAGTTVEFTYTLCDVNDDCSTATVQLAVQATTPVAVHDAFTVPPEAVFAGDVSLNDTLSENGGNAWNVAVAPDAGLLVMQASGAFEYTPDPAAAAGTVSFEYALCDADVDCATASVELDVLEAGVFADSFE